jgi:hypothetical protein
MLYFPEWSNVNVVHLCTTKDSNVGTIRCTDFRQASQMSTGEIGGEGKDPVLQLQREALCLSPCLIAFLFRWSVRVKVNNTCILRWQGRSAGRCWALGPFEPCRKLCRRYYGTRLAAAVSASVVYEPMAIGRESLGRHSWTGMPN